jgi:serine/threonine protein kinase/dienelactone hydrolase
MIGKVISHYQIIEMLGHGGMGEVYLAEDVRLKRKVAIKFLSSLLCLDQEAKERFTREALAAAQLNHPNICTIHEIDEADGQLFIVMEYIRGRTLKEMIQTRSIPLNEAVAIVIQICRGLQDAHQYGIIHRDIKTTNIMITENRQVKIMDFGLARSLGQTHFTKEGTSLGTVAYMSFEQASGQEVDHRTDIWSLGVVLYEMITGKLPFPGDVDQVVIYSILNKEPVPVADFKSGVPEQLEKIILKTLKKDINKRHHSIQELLKELKPLHKEQAAGVTPQVDTSLIKILFHRPKTLIPVSMLFLLLLSLVTWFINRNQKIQWARNTALQEIERLIDQDKLNEAYALALQVEKIIPNDSALTECWRHISIYLTIHSQPPGARVYWKEYAAVDQQWNPLARTPFDSLRLPWGLKRLKIEKNGYQTVYLAPSVLYYKTLHNATPHIIFKELTLDKEQSIPDKMVRVSPVKIRYHSDYTENKLFPDFLIDKFEVTNQAYKQFVDFGGYQKKEYWQHDFIRNGLTLSWEEAMASFTDKTGIAGPATWEAGDYPRGQENYPVTGISWYEAAAYAEFAGKSLPTVYHWRAAAGLLSAPDIISLSNFDDTGPEAVGNRSGMSSYGAFDMAGNAREWCFNQMKQDDKCFILGGGWNDKTYEFTNDHSVQYPFNRFVTNGFRCMQYLETDSSTADMKKPTEFYMRNVYQEKPVSDGEFNVILRMYNYPKTSLNTVVEKVVRQDIDWMVEKISFDAAYGNERVFAYLILPRKGTPPYQTVVYFPGTNVMGMPSDGFFEPYNIRCIDFILKSGRAVLYPVYKGTFERSYNPPKIMWESGRYLQRDFTIMYAKDLFRSIDYLETRTDIDISKLAYYGLSWGAGDAGIILAIEKRLKTGILYVGGLWIWSPPKLPEVETLNFLPRVTIPILMLNGRYDSIYPYETSQLPFFQLLGTPVNKKKHLVYNEMHYVPRVQLIKETLSWLDQYLGPVR